jgi:outer membrane protein assembly factor BamB
MTTVKNFFLLTFAFFIFQACSQKQNNWNQYTGPNRDATIEDAEIFDAWPENGPEEIWSFPLGPGYGGASVYGDEVFVLDRIKGEKDILRCIDLNSGEERWNYEYEAAGELPYPGSRAVPTIDENYVWSVGPHGHFYCFEKETQQPVWSVNILDEFNGELPNWGVSQSPLIYNELAIVAPQGKEAGVVAFDKLTGEIVWKSRPLTGYNFHVSPIVANYGGVDQVVMISPYDRKDSTKTHEVVGFDANTGEELWVYNGLKSFATISPPVEVDEKRLLLTDCSYDGNYNPVTILLEVTKENDKFNVEELFLTEEAGCKMHPAIAIDNHIYLNNNGRPNQLVCFDIEGNLVWESGEEANFEMGSLIRVNGKLISQNGKNGDIHLIEPSPEGYKEMGSASYFNSDKTQAWAPMAFSQGKLLARDLEKLVCIDFTN